MDPTHLTVLKWTRYPCNLNHTREANPQWTGDIYRLWDRASDVPHLSLYLLISSRKLLFFLITLGLELSDTKVYAPYIRALLGTASHRAVSTHERLTRSGPQGCTHKAMEASAHNLPSLFPLSTVLSLFSSSRELKDKREGGPLWVEDLGFNPLTLDPEP